MNKPIIIALDGPDYSGKSTVAEEIGKLLGDKVSVTREPGGKKGRAPFSQMYRSIALDSECAAELSGAEISTFMWASRMAHIKELIEPDYNDGKLIVIDRFDSSTWAYNIVAQNQPELRKNFWLLRKVILGIYEPDLYVYFDVTPEEVMRRKKLGRPDLENHFDKQGHEFQIAMRNGFAEFFEELGKRKERVCHTVIDANRSKEEVWQSVLLILEKFVK